MIVIKVNRVISQYEMKHNKRVTLAWIADQVGISRQAMSNIAGGRIKHMPLGTLGKLCEVLECRVEDILEYEPGDEEIVITQ